MILARLLSSTTALQKIACWRKQYFIRWVLFLSLSLFSKQSQGPMKNYDPQSEQVCAPKCTLAQHRWIFTFSFDDTFTFDNRFSNKSSVFRLPAAPGKGGKLDNPSSKLGDGGFVGGGDCVCPLCKRSVE